MIWLLLEGQAETPIALPRRAQAGNLYESQPEIPGTAVRGAFAGRYLRERGWEGQTLSDEEAEVFEPLFESPALRFGPLRPVPEDLYGQLPNVPVLPVPRSASSCKYDGGLKEEEDTHFVFDGLLRQTRDENKDQGGNGAQTEEQKRRQRTCPRCKAPLEPLDSTWLLARWNGDLQGDLGRHYDPEVRLNTHVGISAVGVDGAGMADEGRLFSLQHFPAETRFRGWIAVGGDGPGQVKEALGLEGTTEACPLVLRVGRRRNSYGALKVWVVGNKAQDEGREAEEQDDSEVPTVTEQPPWEHSHGTLQARWDPFQNAAVVWPSKCPFKREEAHLFSLTCVTDLILLDPFLRPARAITAAQVAKWLEVCAGDVWRLGLVTGTRLMSGWNAAHGLPKETDVAIAAGSVFLFAVKTSALTEPCLLSKLTAWENHGLGWRRSEGFGQVLVCDPWHLTRRGEFDGIVREDLVRLKGVKEEEASPAEKPHTFDHRVLEFLVEHGRGFAQAERRLSRTQLNGLRDRARRLEATRLSGGSEANAREDLRKYLEHAGEKARDSSPWSQRIDRQRLPQALIGCLGLDEGATEWSTILRRVDDFVTGALLLVGGVKPTELRARCAKGGNRNE